MLRDLRLALRRLRQHPAFAVPAIAVMALGVAASTAVFSVLRGVLLAPLPYHDPARVVLFRADLPGVTRTPMLTSLEFQTLRQRTDLFESVAAAVLSDANLTTGSTQVPMSAAAVSDNFLATLGLSPALGRVAGRAEGGRRSINISYEAWQRHFGGDGGAIGTTVEVNGAPVTLAGVLPRGFKVYLGAGAALPSQLDLLYFRSAGYDEDPFRGNVVIARLRRDVTIDAAGAAVDAIATNLVSEHQDRYRSGPLRLSLAPLDAEVVREVKPALLVSAGAVLLVLLIACANLTNVLLAQASVRAHEVAVRVAIGARPRDIVRQLLFDGLVLGAVGAMFGWALALWGVDVLLALAPPALPRREAIVLDGSVALFTVAISCSCAVLVSLVPAWQTVRSGATLAVRPARVRAGNTTRGLLVLAQLALSVMLLVGAGLMARAFVNLRTVRLGFTPQHAASMQIALDGRRWDGGTLDDARALRRGFYERVLDHAQSVPGVRRVGVGFPRPLSGIAMSQRVALAPGADERETDGFIAFAGYLEALDVPLVAGRYFTRADHSQPVVIIDQRLAQELWPGESAIGQRLLAVRTVGPSLWTTVVGVVPPIHSRSPRDAGPPQIWMTYAIRSYAQLTLVVRASDPLAALEQIAVGVHDLGAGRPVRDTRLLEDDVADASADTRFALFVMGVLAALAVVLAAVGVYGVVSYTMAQRTREIAVRLALGASSSQLVRGVLIEGGLWPVFGLIGGLAGAAMLTRYLESLLFGVGSTDIVTFGAVAALLAIVTLLATVVPALRAARVDPMLALRSE